MIENYINIQGINICYRESGEGFPLLLVHGMGSSLVWDYIIELLSKKARIIAIDLPGFGKSDKPKNNYTIDFYLNILEKFINEIKLEKVNLAGLSFGGLLCAEFTVRHPESVDKLLLFASAGLKSVAGYIKNPIIYPLFRLLFKTLLLNRRFLMKFQKVSYYDKNKVDRLVFEKFSSYIRSPGARDAYISALKCVVINDNGFIKRLSSINCPTLIIWGENDPTIPVEYGKKFNQLIKNSIFMIIPECGHTLTIEKPEEFCKLVKEFI
jgi:pimeloyl-ACP methyl ester carboxylesterase